MNLLCLIEYYEQQVFRIKELEAENTRLRAEVEGLREDKERLDWMDQQKEEEYLLVQLMEDDMGTCFSVTAIGGGAYKETIRAAIDAAMKEQP